MTHLTPILLLAIVAVLVGPGRANPFPSGADTRAPSSEAAPSVERLEDGTMRIGKIAFDPKTREIRFPATVNMTEGLLEFLVVHQDGKIHESLFATDISATRLNVAFKLLRYPASRELYLEVNPDGTLSSRYQSATEEEKAGARLAIEAEWVDDGRTKRMPVNGWVSHAPTGRPMADHPWVYGGSFVHEGRFAAEGSGDIAAIFLSNSALINYSGKDNELDEVWFPHSRRVPAVGTPVTLIIQPYESKTPK